MLDWFKFVFVCVGCISSCIWTPLNSNAFVVITAQDKDPTDICLEQASLIENSFDLQELIRLIVELRDYVVSSGGYFPRLPAFLDAIRITMEQQGIEIDDITFAALKAEFARHDKDHGVGYREIKHKHKKHKKEKDVKISSKMACGFLKFVGGSLLCLVPIAAIQGAGASLAIVGISEMVDASRQDSDKKEWEERLDANRRIEHGLDQH